LVPSGADGKGHVQVRHATRPSQKFQPLPAPTGAAPFHLALSDVLEPPALAGIRQSGQLVFHVAGDTGGINQAVPQQIVAMWMEHDLALAPPARPAFFYHLGDVVYFNGDADQYYPQFYEPYGSYAAPILAIPGNHDGDPSEPSVPSLAAFIENFCATTPHLTPEAREVDREAMIQPNVYWTLTDPLVTLVGLYTNVPEGGQLDDDQIAWLRSELADAPEDAALIVAMHHPIYSAESVHSGSAYLGEVLEGAVAQSGRVPDLVLAGHVHNYQRFVRTWHDRQVPFIVAGAGGYWHLHPIMKSAQQTPWQALPDVTLETYKKDRHGYLRLTVTSGAITGEYVTVPRPQESWSEGPVEVFDAFSVDLGTHTVTTTK
jgi:hypothetical protein